MTAKNLSSYLRPRVSVGLPMLLLATLLSTGAAGVLWMALQQNADGAMLSRQIASARAATAVRPLPALSKTEVDQNKRWAELQKERDFAWTPLFNALEAAGNPDIELLEFRPDKPGSTVVLRGEARDEAALLDFMERLAGSPILKRVLLSHRKIRKRDRLVTVAFELKAQLAQTSK